VLLCKDFRDALADATACPGDNNDEVVLHLEKLRDG
jgi:hypothetical protein